ncbi:RecQ family ATP-dependent DNA helicase [Adhaeribacter sp. BT258]|uniref:ATP-dependent DNA helicase RecQ n=1 Tax=Adhaeribacter terrigena TaxID=2793070 RepID=A0ABS1BZ24_9BACT|nr:ATP-dependent DNA helicase RecQ [Adhaeribacter terrigena]MBK0402377.1 RecQ family ATP-dependent DNA helicase [Adhaeribacter terrigena]
MPDIHQILKQYWGYDQFRPLQEDIIQAALAGKDTLALLPTGGGKSICFQVPALAMDGICLVISPLIALMKDQVMQLQKRGIAAVAIHAGLNKREIDIALDNCVYGAVKFLYLSPERLQTDIFRERVKKMNVCLLAVDEAHCISQWGYDFRPPYLQIAELRDVLPEIPILALTATATETVKKDIQEKLAFKQENVFQSSFARANLSYSAQPAEDKINRLSEVLKSVPGTAIVYVRSRKRTVEIANELLRRGFKAAPYHAGLSFEQRNQTQTAWLENRVQVMVATNAFGMGIDKPDVRLVVHIDLPDTLEAYYQEAGRAGRDGRYAYAVVLFAPNDLLEVREKIEEAHPPIEVLRKTYQALANFYQIAVGSGEFVSFDFNLEELVKTYKLNPLETHHSLKKLETEGFLQLNDAYFSPSKVYVPAGKEELYKFQVANRDLDPLLKLLLRMYGGELFTNFVKISERSLSQALKVPQPQIVKMLQFLHKAGVIVYEPPHDKPQVIFTTPRYDAATMPLNQKKLQDFRKLALEKADAVVRYVQTANRCRTQMLLEYFGEITDESCRICDYCLQQKKLRKQQQEMAEIEKQILELLKDEPLLPKILVGNFPSKHRETAGVLLREMIDSGKLKYLESGELTVRK